ncbi:ArnT family glycosyltransferase [Vogesella fluminis]|uniref:ArnT family glycosyltransferase n=1 Tax=Vogesella fluminis TaxID=1069161 RepID=UPI003626E143
MLTYSDSSPSRLPAATEKPWLLLLLTFAWLWPGILGHTPWKPDEPYVTAVVQHMLAGGPWWLPAIDGQAYLDSAPLYYWVATLFARLLSPWLLSLHDAARLATPLFMAIGLAFAGGVGRELIGGGMAAAWC